jgi:hypothetical protein
LRQPQFAERLAGSTTEAEAARRDGGQYRRIVLRRLTWPDGLGVAIEWTTRVDPFAGNSLKYGILTLFPGALGDIYPRLRERVTNIDLRKDGFKLLSEQVWPVVRYVPKSEDWWQRLDEWRHGIVDSVVLLWDRGAPVIDSALDASSAPATSAIEL